MGLTDDQRALLRLLAQREEGYEDIAALKGLSVEQVRAEVKEALAEMQAAGEAPPPLPPPPAKAEEPAPPAAEPEAEQELPPPPPERPLPPTAAKSKATGGRPSGSTLPAERRRIVLLTAGALGIVAVILAAIAIFGGGSDSGSDEANGAGSGAETAATAEENGKLTQAELEPVDGSDASGRAVFGRLGKKIVLQVTADGLQPTDDGQSYIVWLYRSPKLTLRVGSVTVDESGKLGARFAIPAELLAYVASGAFDQIYVSRADDAAYQQEVAQAKKNKSLPRYTGETVLTGPITGPIAKTASNGG
jgi:hypothetical protein